MDIPWDDAPGRRPPLVCEVSGGAPWEVVIYRPLWNHIFPPAGLHRQRWWLFNAECYEYETLSLQRDGGLIVLEVQCIWLSACYAAKRIQSSISNAHVSLVMFRSHNNRILHKLKPCIVSHLHGEDRSFKVQVLSLKVLLEFQVSQLKLRWGWYRDDITVSTQEHPRWPGEGREQGQTARETTLCIWYDREFNGYTGDWDYYIYIYIVYDS